jgi:hypothetical protein
MNGLKKTMKNLGQNTRYPGQDLNETPTEYTGEVTPLEPTYSVYNVQYNAGVPSCGDVCGTL